MPSLNSSRFFAHIESDGPAPAYLLTGEDAFLVDRALESIMKRFVDEAARDFNFELFYARDSKTDDIASQAQTLPMMAERRTIVVKEADRLKALGPIKDYMESPSPTTLLVLVAPGAERAKESELAKVLGPKAVTVHFYRPSDAETSRWIGRIASGAGYRIEPDAVNYLKDVLGDDLALIEAEMLKVFNFAGGRKTISYKDVEEAVGDFGMPVVFELVDQVADKNTGKAIEMLHRLLKEGEAPVMVLGMLSRHWRRLLEARERLSLGDGPAELEKRFRLNFKTKDRFIRQTNRLGAPELRNGFMCIGRADQALKSSRLPERIVMERLVLELSGYRGL